MLTKILAKNHIFKRNILWFQKFEEAKKYSPLPDFFTVGKIRYWEGRKTPPSTDLFSFPRRFQKSQNYINGGKPSTGQQTTFRGINWIKLAHGSWSKRLLTEQPSLPPSPPPIDPCLCRRFIAFLSQTQNLKPLYQRATTVLSPSTHFWDYISRDLRNKKGILKLS